MSAENSFPPVRVCEPEAWGTMGPFRQRRESEVHRIDAGRVVLRLGRLGLDGEDAQVAHLARRLEARRASDGEQERQRALHQNFPFTPSVGRMGRPEMLPSCR